MVSGLGEPLDGFPLVPKQPQRRVPSTDMPISYNWQAVTFALWEIRKPGRGFLSATITPFWADLTSGPGKGKNQRVTVS